MKKTITIGRNTKVTLDLDKLNKIQKEFSKKYAARVGILGSKTNRVPMLEHESHQQYKARVQKLRKNKEEAGKSEELTNADIGAQNEFGVASRNIPPRSFLRVPLTLEMPKYANTFKGKLLKAMDEGNIKPAFIDLGIKGVQIVQMAFAKHGPGWSPNAPLTIALKGSSSPLIDTGQLRASIASDVISK